MIPTPGRSDITLRRVSIQAADPVTGEVFVTDPTGWTQNVRATTRVKGSGFPAVGEIWLCQRLSSVWVLTAQVGHIPPPAVTGPRAGADAVTLSLLDALVALGLVDDRTS